MTRDHGLAESFAALPWERLALGGIVLLASLLRLLWIDGQGYANTYYAATVKTMLTSWHNFFFGSFDPAGFVTVDKPPLGLWIQAVSARFLGFDGLSLILPQALAGVASVALLYLLIRRTFDPAAGLFAALVLALTPVAVVTERNNTPDALVVLAMLGALWATTRALARGELRWLLLAATFVGLGFNVKMLQAYLVVPAIFLTYVFMAPLSRGRRVLHLAAATIVLIGVSLSWSLAVDLTPASERPYVGSSGTNSALSLALGYNGLGRLAKAVGLQLGTIKVFGLSLDLAEAPGFAPGIGAPGPLRLFTPELAGQSSWLLPLALIGLVVGGWWLARSSEDAASMSAETQRSQRHAIVLWAICLLTQLVFFSVADFFHTYYLITLGPPIAAMSAIAIYLLWRLFQRGSWARLWLPLALVVTALGQALMLAPYEAWRNWLVPPVICGAVLVGAGLLALRHPRRRSVALVAGALILLIAPATWSAMAASDGSGGSWLPYAGPSWMSKLGRSGFGEEGERPSGFAGGPNGSRQRPIAMTVAGSDWNVIEDGLLDYLREHQGSATFLVATESSSYASVIMLATDEPAMALGGYQGWDEILSPSELVDLVRRGGVRFFLLPEGESALPSIGTAEGVNDDLASWVTANCASVPESAWQGSPARPAEGDEAETGRDDGFGFVATQRLYDCGA